MKSVCVLRLWYIEMKKVSFPWVMFGNSWSKWIMLSWNCYCVIFADNVPVWGLLWFSDIIRWWHSVIPLNTCYLALWSKQPEVRQRGSADAQCRSPQTHTAEAGLAAGAHARHPHCPTAWWENQQRALYKTGALAIQKHTEKRHRGNSVTLPCISEELEILSFKFTRLKDIDIYLFFSIYIFTDS